MNTADRERRRRLLEQGEPGPFEPVELAPPEPSPTVVVSVRMPARLADLLAARAAAEGTPTGTYTRELIEHGLREQGASEWSIAEPAPVPDPAPGTSAGHAAALAKDDEFAVAN